MDEHTGSVGVKGEILTKKRRLSRNRKYLVAVTQPLPMVAALSTTDRTGTTQISRDRSYSV